MVETIIYTVVIRIARLANWSERFARKTMSRLWQLKIIHITSIYYNCM